MRVFAKRATLFLGALLTTSAGFAQAPPVVLRLEGGRCSLALASPGQSVPLIREMGYRVVRADGSAALRTAEAQLVRRTEDATVVHFALEGSMKQQATVEATIRRAPRGVLCQWRFRYDGPSVKPPPASAGFTFDWAKPVEAASCGTTSRWVRPTGRHEWEVRGDMPYPDLESQIRKVSLRDAPPLAIVTTWYDPDWLYGGNIRRARFMRYGWPSRAASECKVTFAVLNAEDAEREDLAAILGRHPVSLRLTTGRVGNLFAPGEPVRFFVRLQNETGETRETLCQWEVWDYYGGRAVRGERSLRLKDGEVQRWPVVMSYRQRGILFAVVRVRSGEWEREQWFTMGILPRRPLTPPRPDSPFGLAAIIANPRVYPDQPDLETVLALAQRIGVRWVRSCPFPVKAKFSADEVLQARRRVALFRRYGMMLHPQISIRITQKKNWPDILRTTLKTFRWVSPYIELGNELNQRPARDYVEQILKPFHDGMREAHPQGRVMTHGLAGVQRKYLQALEKAGAFQWLDILSIHPGFHPRAPEFYEGWRGWVFRTQMEDALDFARRHGKEIWITEVYAPTPPSRSAVDLRTSADYLVRTYVLALAMGVRVVEWYQFQDGVWHSRIPKPTDTEYNYGIVYTDLSPKPAYIAYGVMTEQLEGSRCVGRLNLGADDLYGIRFVREGERIDVLWSYRERHETDLAWWPPKKFQNRSRRPALPWETRWRHPVRVSLPATGVVTVCDIMGNARTLRPQNGAVTLSLTGSPLFVRGLGSLPIRTGVWSTPGPR